MKSTQNPNISYLFLGSSGAVFYEINGLRGESTAEITGWGWTIGFDFG
jgi:hypothetical protein